MMPMRLEMMTGPDAAAHLARTPGVIWPMGSTEQHGPHGLIGTDHLCAEAIARRFGAAQGVIVLPTLAVGQSHFQLGFPGSLALRPSTLMAVVTDHLAALETTGVRRLYILNGHGGNVAPVRSAIAEFHAGRSFAGADPAGHIVVRLRSWWELAGVNALRQRLYGADEGFHATPSEIAITQAAYPEVIGEFDAPAPPRGHDMTDHAGDNYEHAATFRRSFPDGRVLSHSALARRADGEALLAAAMVDLTADFAAFMAG
jgi:creatinine amidohydrolase